MKNIYRGIWAEKLENGQDLPIGGSNFLSDELDTNLLLDFKNLTNGAEYFPDKISETYQKNKKNYVRWLEKVGTDFSPYLFFVSNLVLNKVQSTLDPAKPGTSTFKNMLERNAKIKESGGKISAMKGIAACSEQAAFGQYLLQNILEKGYNSAYVGGVEAQKENDFELNYHSFIVLNDKEKKDKTYIFDIARPRSQQNLPRILETDVPFNYELLKGKDNLLVKSREVLQGGEIYFGVGTPGLMGVKPKILEK